MEKINAKALLTKVFTSIGIDLEDKGIKKLLSEKSLEAISVEPETAQIIAENYLTKEAALNHSEIRDAIKGEFSKETDGAIEKVLKDLGADEKVSAKILGSKKYTDKLKSITELVEKLSTEKAGISATEKEKSLAAKVNEMQELIAKTTEEYEGKIAGINKERETEKLTAFQESVLSSLKFANKKATPETNILLAKSLIQNELASKKVKLALDGTNIKLVNEDGTEYFEKNKPAKFSDFATSSLMNAGLLDVSAGTDNGNRNVQTPTHQRSSVGNNGGLSYEDMKKVLLT